MAGHLHSRRPSLLLLLLCAAWGVARAAPSPPRDLPCSAEERACFAYGRLLHADGSCYRVNERGPCRPGETFVANKTEALRSGGRLAGGCARPCAEGAPVRLAAGGQCVSDADHHAECARHPGLQPALNHFGEGECACAGPQCARPPPGAAARPGRCAAPDLLRPAPAPRYRPHLLGKVPPCTEAEHACLARGAVLARGECHALRTRGPCAPDEWLVLDAAALHGGGALDAAFSLSSYIRPVCQRRPCPAGSAALASERRCRPLAELRTRLCAGEHLLYDVLGFVGCERQLPTAPELPPLRSSDGRCASPAAGVHFAVGLHGAGAECAQGDDGACAKQVDATPPPFLLLPEDD